MASIYRPKGSMKYRIAYRDAQGRRVTVGGYRDKQATLAKARKLEQAAERAAAGIAPTTHVETAKAIDHYLADLIRRGSPAAGRHLKETARILQAASRFFQCQWLANITCNLVTQYLGTLAHRAPRTRNRHHETLRGLFNFCASQHWTTSNPLHGIKPARVGQAGRRHNRRAFTDDEIYRLLACPDARSTERLRIYAVAAYSGLRRNELAQLCRDDCTPIGDKPRWHLRAEITKNRQTANLPMTYEAAQAISVPWGNSSSNKPIFQSIPAVTTLYSDMQKAGIERFDAEGRRLDFHSFRYFFCKTMAKVLPIQKVKTLMRHSSITLTADLYGHLGLQDVAEDVWTLPQLTKKPPTTTNFTDQDQPDGGSHQLSKQP